MEANDWGEAFKPSSTVSLENIRVDDGHFVLANANCDYSEIRAS